MKNSFKYLILVALFLSVATLFYIKVYIPKTSYKTEEVSVGNLHLNVFGIGTLSAKTIYNVSAGVNAKVLELFKEEGEWVKQGDLLAKLDSIDMPILLEQSKINVKKSRSELVALQKELESLHTQKSLALLTFERYEKLKKQSYASESEYDKAKADLDVIQSQIKATKAHIDSAKTAILFAQKSVLSLKEKLSRYNVYSPTDGYIIANKSSKGSSVLTSQTLYEIINPKDVWIKAYVDERLSGNLKKGQSATISLRSHPEQSYKAVLKRIAAQSDSVTQEREVDVAFEALPIPFYMNEQAEVSIDTKVLRQEVILPTDAIIYTKTGAGVWLKVAHKAHFTPVTILGIKEKKAAVSGLNTNAILILPTLKNKKLSEGMEIR